MSVRSACRTASRSIFQPSVMVFVVAFLLLMAGDVFTPGFASWRQMRNILVVGTFLAFVSGGQTLVVLSGNGGIDLSLGTTMTFAAIISGNIMAGTDGTTIIAIVAALVACFLVGALNGVGVEYFRIPPLVMTLGMFGVLKGLMVVMTQGARVGSAAPQLVSFVSSPWLFGLSGVVFLLILFTLFYTIVLRNSVFGYAVYAMGSNQRAAELTGIPVSPLRVLVYGVAGMIAGLTGVLLLGYTKTVYTSMGDAYALPSVIAVVIGGTLISGGKGTYIGTVGGALFLTVLQAFLTSMQIPPFGRQIVYGTILVVLMLVYGRQQRLRE